MSIEEKAKAYDEALERARRIKNGEGDWRYSDLIEIGSALTEIFPQLKENNDERIRKKLIKTIRYFRSRGIDQQLCEEFLAYLEKQKDKMTKDEFENSDLFQLKLKTKYCDGYQDALAQKETVKVNINGIHGLFPPVGDGHYIDEHTALDKTAVISQDVYSDEKQKENIEKEYVFRPLAGTDITIAAEQAIRRANEGDHLVLAFNGAYIPIRKGCNANEIVDIYDAFIEKQKAMASIPDELVKSYKSFFENGRKEGEIIVNAINNFIKQKEQKEIPLMNGDADLYFDNWIQHNNTTKRRCFEEGIRYAQRLQKEQKPVTNEKAEMTDFEQSVYDLCPVLGIEEAKATALDLLELAKKTLLKTGKVVLASNYPEGCSFEDGFHLGYNEGFNAKKELKPVEQSDDELQRHQDELHDFKVFAAKQAKEHHISFVHDFEWNNFCEELLSYFNEKQKSAEWSEEDDERVEQLIYDTEHIRAECEERKKELGESFNDDLIKDCDEQIAWLKALPERFNLQPKVEWNEEDKRIVNDILARLEDLLEDNTRTQVFKTTIKSDIDFLKSLRPQPKQEWSDEDEKTLNAIIDMVGNSLYEPLRPRAMILSWLNSLRPQFNNKEIYQAAKHDLAIKFMKYLDENRPDGKMCLSNGECDDIDKAFKENDLAKIERYIHKYHWKPSKEQMNALNALNCHGDLSYVGQQNQLISLYNDLKKLM